MNSHADILAFGTRLADELGDRAVAMCRVRLVELIAANHSHAAGFWRQVLLVCEERLSKGGP